MATGILDIQQLRESLAYDSDTGVLTWKTRPLHHFKNARSCNSWNSSHAGKVTGWPDPKGYLRVNIRGTPYLAHQLAWAIYHGEFVPQIDHRNTIHGDNRIDNLRRATGAQNQHNRPRSRNNTSGYKGVCLHAGTGKWRAYVVKDWKQFHVGLFDTPEEAFAARNAAAELLHGEFANHGASTSETAISG